MKKKILLIGPFPKPVTGNSLANKTVYNLLELESTAEVNKIDTSYNVFKEDIGKFSLKKLFFYVIINFRAHKIFNYNILYLTPGQTFLGILKYATFICLGALLKKEMIIHVHGNHLGHEYKMLSGIKKRAFSFLISRFTKGIVLSNSLKSNLTPFIDSSKIFVLPNFAEDYLVSQKLKVNTDQLRIIFLSNLMKEKGILILLDALHALEKNKIKHVAKIAGNIDVDSYQEINSKVKRLEKTTYLGVVEGDRKKELLNWGNVFVLPTFYKIEGQPISIIEAMATKNVIITTAHSGIPDIVKENKNGFFVDKKKVAPLIERLMFLSSRKDIIKNISEYNKTFFLDNFSLEIFQKKLFKILEVEQKKEFIKTSNKNE